MVFNEGFENVAISLENAFLYVPCGGHIAGEKAPNEISQQAQKPGYGWETM